MFHISSRTSRPGRPWTLQRRKRPSGHQSVAPQASQTFILPTPARRVCRTSCSHAGVTESWLGRSRLLPNCAFQSCCALGVTTGLHAVWGHSSGRRTDGIPPSRVSLKQRSPQLCICRLSGGHQSSSRAAPALSLTRLTFLSSTSQAYTIL